MRLTSETWDKGGNVKCGAGNGIADLLKLVIKFAAGPILFSALRYSQLSTHIANL